jgi:outer membrane protein assembly factor BamC
VREFWQESGFVLAVEQPQVGMMETDFAENRAEGPNDFFRRTVGKYLDVFYSTYKQDKFQHAHRARRRAGTGRSLHLASRHGAGADRQDRQLVTGGLRVGGDAAQSVARSGDADASHDEVRHA